MAFQDYGESTVEYHRKPTDHTNPSKLLHREADLPRTPRCIELDVVADLTYGQTPSSDQDRIKVDSRTLLHGGEKTNGKSQSRPNRHSTERDEEAVKL